MTIEGKPLTEILASFVAETPASDVPQAAVEPAKDLILDTVGVALAATHRSIGKIITGYVAEIGSSPATATVLGAGIKVSPEMAAFANGTLANALDFDEGSHLPTHVLPAALALAEHHRLSGKEVLDAFIVGYEAGARLTQAIDARRRQRRGPTHRGWWHVGLVGPIAAALTACRLIGLDRRQTAMAIGIATCSSGGFRRNMGTMAKAVHSGNAARAGIEAASLARRGFTSDPAIIEAPLGFLQAVCLPEDLDTTAIDRLGRPYVLEGPLRMKRFPACNPGHPLIDAALQLCSQPNFSVEDIESIEADLHTFSLLRAKPWDEESAGFSGAFLLAATLIYGVFGLDQLADNVVHDAHVAALMKLVRHVPASEKETLTAFLRGNRVVSVEVLPVRRLTTRQSVREKFRQCAEAVLAREPLETVENEILRLEKLPDIIGLMAAARGSTRDTDRVHAHP